ncbi:hypothetical protein [Nitrospira sp. KM1]|uniref:hypothetical protein n=1 Tax=Nitrospira sp. KM1 TaxID=1936990 RepID=UPI0015650541|nr:hypothetical protein [Nitrospira sp. KM1]
MDKLPPIAVIREDRGLSFPAHGDGVEGAGKFETERASHGTRRYGGAGAKSRTDPLFGVSVISVPDPSSSAFSAASRCLNLITIVVLISGLYLWWENGLFVRTSSGCSSSHAPGLDLEESLFP